MATRQIPGQQSGLAGDSGSRADTYIRRPRPRQGRASGLTLGREELLS